MRTIKIHEQTKLPRWLGLVSLLIALTVLAGCSGHVVGRIDWSKTYDVYGVVQLRDTGLPLFDATLTFDGPVRRSVSTDRKGRYSLRLPAGDYRVTLHSVHGTHQERVRVQSHGTVFNWYVRPAWSFDRSLFYEMSGLYRIYANPSGQIDWDYGEIHRWEKSQVAVYFDYARSDSWANPGWSSRYWDVVNGWRPILNHTVNFRQVSSLNQADVIVQWVPPGSLGDHIAVLSSYYYENGALDEVLIKIDVDHGNDLNLWSHEWARAMGLSYVSVDRFSVLFPYYVDGQRNSLTPAERNHARLVYDLPSGLRLNPIFGTMALDPDADDVDLAELVEEIRSTGYWGHMVTVDGDVLELNEAEAQSHFMLR